MPVSASNFGIQGFAFPVVEEAVGTGTAACDYPAVGDVREGVSYSDGDLVGTLEIPAESDVRWGVGYGEGGTEFTGSYGFPASSGVGTQHSPADVLRWLLVLLEIVTDPALSQSWPGYCSQEPNAPDNCVTTFDTDGVFRGRYEATGEMLARFGVQVRIRADRHTTGWAKAVAIREALDESILRETITIGSATYCVHSFQRTSGIVDLGKEVGVTKRHLFTINGLMTVRKTN